MSNQKHVIYLPKVCAKKEEEEKECYIHNPLDLLDNPVKFQLNQIRPQSFQLKLSNIAVTLKHGQGQWKWYKQVKPND